KAAEAEADLAERAAGVQAATQAVFSVLPGALLGSEDAAILSAAAAQSEARGAAFNEAEAEAQRARETALVAKAEQDSAKKRIKERKEAFKRAKETLQSRRKRIDETASKMPADLRPRPPYQAADIIALGAKVELRRLKIAKVVEELEETRVA